MSPKVTTSVQNFTNGEISPRALGRFDLAKYLNSAKTVENFFINQLGGVSFRTGSRYIASTKDNGEARLFPFQYSSDQDYVVEAGDLYFRLYSNGADLISNTVNLTKILFPSDGVDGSFEHLDGGNTGHIMTTAGTAQTNHATRRLGNASLLLDGDSDYLTAPDHADWDFPGDFSLEAWVMMKSVASDMYIMSNDGDGTEGFDLLYLQSAPWLRINIHGTTLQWSWTPVVDTWYHVAISRSSGTVYAFINGISLGAGVANSTSIASTTDLHIGKDADAATYFNGYIDELRISKGIARWTTDFSASLLVISEYVSDANTQLLLHCNSQDISSSAHRLEFKGTAQLDTGAKKWGTGSLLLDGNSDYLQIPDSVAFDLINSADEDWTIDLWVKHTDHVGTETYVIQWEDVNNYWLLQHVHGSGLRFIAVSGGATIITTGYAGEIAGTDWTHVAVVKKASEYGLYKGGAQIAYVRDYSTDTFDGDLYVGATGTPASYFDGNIDDLRIINSNAFTASPNANNTDTIVIPTSAHTASASSQTEIVTPYEIEDVFKLQMAQSNDIMYITHPLYAPRKLSRTSSSVFTLTLVPFVRGPLMDANVTATTITPSADTGDSKTLTASTAIFNVLHIGALFRVKEGLVKISAFTSSTVVTGDIQAEPDGSAGDLNTGPGATTDWAEGAFSDYRGWPNAIAFHEQRLHYSNTETEPQKTWGSYIGAYDSFDTTATTDDFSVAFAIATDQRNAIRWISSNKNFLSMGTTGGTFSASGGSNSVITPTSILINRDTNYGVANLQPQRISSYLYYIQRNLKRLRELSYFYDNDAIKALDMTLLADHVLSDGDGIVQIDHQQAPNDRIWAVRDDGVLAVLTRNPEQEVTGWGRVIGGTDSVQAGKYESVAVIPKSEEDDQVWVIVNRTIGGVTKRFIEFFTPENFDDDWDSINVDSSLTLDSPITITGATKADPVVITAASHGFSNGDQVKIDNVVGMTELNGLYFLVANKTDDTFELQTLASVDVVGTAYTTYISGGEVREMVTVISGLDHLEGETVSVQTDGSIPGTETYVVASGAFTLSRKSAVVHAGLPYTGTLKLLKLSDGSATGTGQTKTRRIYNAAIRVDRSLGIKIGRNTTNMDRVIAYAFDSDSFPPSLTTGDVEKIPNRASWSKGDEITIVQDKPLPLNILAIILLSEVQDR